MPSEGIRLAICADNPQKLNDRGTLLSEDLGRSYSFEDNPDDPSFEVIVRVAASLEETQGLFDDPAKYDLLLVKRERDVLASSSLVAMSDSDEMRYEFALGG